jgi:hypothetical protein
MRGLHFARLMIVAWMNASSPSWLSSVPRPDCFAALLVKLADALEAEQGALTRASGATTPSLPAHEEW